MIKDHSKKQNPLLHILAIGLEVWLRSQCQSLGELNIKLKGKTIKILKGIIDEVKVSANKINFKGLRIEGAEFTTSIIKLNFSINPNNQIVSFQEKFVLGGRLTVSSTGLSKTVSSKEWNWIKNLMSETLVEGRAITNIQIQNNKLKLDSLDKNNESFTDEFYIRATNGSIEFNDSIQSQSVILPMDPSIVIKTINICEDIIYLRISSTVTPLDLATN